MPKKDLRLTVYDFDDTIYNGDSSMKFWWFLLAKRPVFLFLIPYFIILLLMHGLGIINRDRFKQAFYLPIHKVPRSQLRSWVNQYWSKERNNINSWFKKRLEEEKKQGLLAVCISASPRFLLEDIINELDIPHLICTEMKVQADMQTNRIAGSNCRGQEKVRRLNKWAQDMGKSYIIQKFASDSKADLPLYKLAQEKFYVHKGHIEPGSP